jgi:hypothetical protein
MDPEKVHGQSIDGLYSMCDDKSPTWGDSSSYKPEFSAETQNSVFCSAKEGAYHERSCTSACHSDPEPRGDCAARDRLSVERDSEFDERPKQIECRIV